MTDIDFQYVHIDDIKHLNGQQLIYCTDCRGNRIYALDKSTYFDKYDLLKFIPKLTRLGVIVTHKDNPKHKPDAWIDRNGELIPVECKLHDFDTKALKQLTRYMTFYHTEHGIAVARNLTVKLPNNIEFVPFSKFAVD